MRPHFLASGEHKTDDASGLHCGKSFKELQQLGALQRSAMQKESKPSTIKEAFSNTRSLFSILPALNYYFSHFKTCYFTNNCLLIVKILGLKESGRTKSLVVFVLLALTHSPGSAHTPGRFTGFVLALAYS